MSEQLRIVSLQDLSNTVGVSMALLYKLSRVDQIPGQFRVGQRVMVDLDEFLEKSKNKEPQF
jgi:hypothetical protein